MCSENWQRKGEDCLCEGGKPLCRVSSRETHGLVLPLCKDDVRTQGLPEGEPHKHAAAGESSGKACDKMHVVGSWSLRAPQPSTRSCECF